MKRIIVVSLIFLSACGSLIPYKDPRTIRGVNPVFTSYIDKYISYKGHSLYYYIPMQFADLSGDFAGLCTRWSTGERQIQIDKFHWNYLNEGERFELIAHELGHCDLNRDHINVTKNGSPISIMYPYVFGIYDLTIDNYMEELFNPTVSTFSTSLTSTSECVNDIEVESSSNLNN